MINKHVNIRIFSIGAECWITGDQPAHNQQLNILAGIRLSLVREEPSEQRVGLLWAVNSQKTRSSSLIFYLRLRLVNAKYFTFWEPQNWGEIDLSGLLDCFSNWKIKLLESWFEFEKVKDMNHSNVTK